MTPTAIYDTNVVVSATLKPGSIPAALIAFVMERQVRLFLSPEILKEYTDVLYRPKFRLSPRRVTQFLHDLTTAATTVTPTSLVTRAPDDDDNRFLECARATHAGYLVTGNKRHFPFPEFEGTRIVSPAEFMRIMM